MTELDTGPAVEDPQPTDLADSFRDIDQAVQECLEALAVYVYHETKQGDANDQPQGGVRPEVSVVLPCLDEAESIAACVGKAQRALREAGLAGEVVVADNGSRDASRSIALQLGARVVDVAARGYGSAVRAGIAAAHGRFIVLADADDRYDLAEIPKLLKPLQEGRVLVQGCRLPRGGGVLFPGAMPLSQRCLGHPLLSAAARRLSGAPFRDAGCRLRAFTREFYERLDMRSTGMDFPTEMILKSGLLDADVAEAPVTWLPSGRKSQKPTYRVRHELGRVLRFWLMTGSRWLFAWPGTLLIVLGLLVFTLAGSGTPLLGTALDANTMLVASLGLCCGWQLVATGLLAKAFGVSERYLPHCEKEPSWLARQPLRRWLLAGGLGVVSGAACLAGAFSVWQAGAFGAMNQASTMGLVVPGVTLVALGSQTALSGLLLGLLRTARR